jgi:hypothetical protein
MSKFVQLQQDLTSAMKAGDAEKVSTLRLIVSELKNTAIDSKTNVESLDDSKVESVIEKQAKQRKDSIEAFENAGREDLVKKEQAELEIINTYLPQKLSESETKDAVKDAINQSGVSDMSGMGQIMGLLKQKHGSTIDMTLASTLLKDLLS